MQIIITEQHRESCKIAADMIAGIVRRKPDARLGLATGSSAEGVYDELVRAYLDGTLDFSGVSTVNLDEYVGLGPEHPQSYRYYMDLHLFSRVNISGANTYIPKGTGDLSQNVEAFRRVIAARKADIQLLGIGENGHIGFNEPGPALYAQAHVTQLEQTTIVANARFFDSVAAVPTQAVTMGIGDILSAKKLLLIASGQKKAAALKGLLLADTLSTYNPATLIKLHPDATVILDRALAEAMGYVK